MPPQRELYPYDVHRDKYQRCSIVRQQNQVLLEVHQGYIHLFVKPVRTDKITIKLKGEAKESDAFGQIVEVVEPNAGDLDLLRVKGGEKTNNELRIVEVEFLETLKK